MCRGEPSPEQFLDGLSIVDACLRIVSVCRPKWWALENPQGYLKRWLGEPQFKFDPCEYGDAYTKRTWLWGKFVPPNKRRVLALGPLINSRTRHPKGKRGIARNQEERSATPPGFAQAFMEANP
jgi:hypothetical protein